MSSTLPRSTRTLGCLARPCRCQQLPCFAHSSSPLSVSSQQSLRRSSSTASSRVDPATLLSTPSWSVRSLISSPSSTAATPSASSGFAETHISQKQLHHLLRLSALPLPSNPAEESKMISTLQSQLLFVRDIQAVDVEGVEPLRSIRDETQTGFEEATIGVEQLRDALAQEVSVGRSRRPRRRKDLAIKSPPEVEGWNPLQTAAKTRGPYFVVGSGKNKP